MAANGKNSRRKKKRHIKKGPVLIAVILLLCGIGWLTYLYHEQIINKAKDIPNSFSYPTDYEEYVIRYSTKYKCDPVADILNDLWEGGRQRIAALNELC